MEVSTTTKMTSEIQLAIYHAFGKLFEDGVPPPSFLEENRTYHYGGFFDLGLYSTDDDSLAGYVQSEIRDGKLALYMWVYRGHNRANYCGPNSTFEREFKGKQLYMASMKDKTKWKVDIEQTPTWGYDIRWNTYFNDVFDSDWDNVGKYFYEVKSKLPFNLGNRTLRMKDSEERWVILKDGMIMNLDNDNDKAEFDETVTLKGIPIQYLMYHMLPRISTFVSKVELIQKLKNRIGDKYTKSVLAMEDNGNLHMYRFTACHVYWGAKELTISEIEMLIHKDHLWDGESLKLLTAK